MCEILIEEDEIISKKSKDFPDNYNHARDFLPRIINKEERFLSDFSKLGFQKAEKLLIKPKIAIPLIVLVLLNWIWNIVKGL